MISFKAPSWFAAFRIPKSVWGATTLVAALKMVPLLSVVWAQKTGRSVLVRGTFPLDFAAYAAWIQNSSTPALGVVNPFTTEVQSGRFTILFLQLLGFLNRFLKWDPFWLIEISRIPLVFLFSFTAWHFLEVFFKDERPRRTAMFLLLLSSGFSGIGTIADYWLRPPLLYKVQDALTPLNGWSLFEGFYNPLWIAGQIGLLICFRPLFFDSGPKLRFLILSLGTTLLFFTHPYTGLVVFLVYGLDTAAVLYRQGERLRFLQSRAGLIVGGCLCGLITLWQLGDPVYRKCSGGILGVKDVSVFWYPIVLGTPLVFAAMGWKAALVEPKPWFRPLAIWTLVVIVLHSSPVLNGFHYAMFLPLPIGIAAAEPFHRFLKISPTDFRQRAGQLLVISLTFCMPLILTLQSILVTPLENMVDPDTVQVIRWFQQQPQGNIFGPLEVCSLIPAYSTHRVYVGHWFLTPDYFVRRKQSRDFLRDPKKNPEEIASFLARNQIHYVIVEATDVDRFLAAVSPDWKIRARIGEMVIFQVLPQPVTGQNR